MRWVVIGLLLLATTTSTAKELSSRELSNYKRLLQNLVQGQSKPRLGELIKELAEYDDPRAYQLILPAATLIPSAKNYEAALDAIARVTSEKVIEELVETAGKRNIDLRWRVLLVDGFARRIDETTRKSLLDLVQDRDTRIVVAVIRAMSARQERDSIPALINLLEKINTSRDRVWLETRHALVKLTGQDYDAIEDWKKFAETLPADFDPKKLGEGDGLTKVNIKKVDDSVEFFGEEIYSRNLVFVIDVSGSMMMWDDSESYSGSNAENDLQRLKRAKEQLYAALGKLPKGTKFNVIAYSDKVISWKKDLQPATSASIKSATQFVSGFKAEGLTHTDDALKRAFEDLAVDTIVLLSDGAPGKQNADTLKLIRDTVEWVRDVNPVRKIRIDTFGFTKPGNWPERIPGAPVGARPQPPSAEHIKVFVEFLQELANSTGGTFRSID